MTTLLIVIGLALAASVVTWFFLNRQNPESMSEHGAADRPETTSEQLYGGADRPAGPDAMTMDPDALGGDHRPPPVGG